jgi:GDP-4-dehydro-6-deoxy-D-mannose reductase
MRVLITGVRGFTGRHLLEHLGNSSDAEVFGADIGEDLDPKFHACDLTDCKSVSALLHAVEPDRIYHLAGTFTNNYEIDHRTNVLITKNLLDEVVAGLHKCRILLVGSSAEYGLVHGSDNPVNESHPLNPVSIYGLTKVYQTYLMKLYCSLHNLDIVMVRPFNLMGKGISERLFVGRVQRQIVDYKAGVVDRIRVGNLDNCRDYIHIAKAVSDYALVMKAGTSGEVYNVGSGKSIVMRDLLSNILQENGLDVSVVESMPSRLGNKMDIAEIYADITKIDDLRRIRQ